MRMDALCTTRLVGRCAKSVRGRARLRAFSLVEILVVIAIIGILLAVVFRGGSSLIGNSKARSTEGLLRKLDLALDEYKREVDHSQIPFMRNGFNGYPPDDLRVFFTGAGTFSIGGCELRLRNRGFFEWDGSTLSNPNDLVDDRDGSGQLIPDYKANPRQLKHGDIRAMVLAMRLYSPKARAVLDTIKDDFWAPAEESKRMYYNPNDGTTPIQLDYLVDAWGNPIEYYATCYCDSGPYSARDHASNAFVHENNDSAILVSYGEDGSDQFASDFMQSEGDTSMVADFMQEFDTNDRTGGVINHQFNTDNVYSSDTFAERMRQTTGG